MLRKFSEHLKQLRENHDGCLGVVSGQAIMGGSSNPGLDLPDMETDYNEFLEALRQKLEEKKKMSGKLIDAETGDGEVVEPTSTKDVPSKDGKAPCDDDDSDDLGDGDDGDEIALMKKKMKDVKKKMAEALERIEESKKSKKMGSGSCPKCGEEGCSCKEKKKDFLKLAGIDSSEDEDEDSDDSDDSSSKETPEMMKKKMKKESSEEGVQGILDMMRTGVKSSENWDGLPQ